MPHLTLCSDTGIWIFLMLELQRQYNLNRIHKRLESYTQFDWAMKLHQLRNGTKNRTKILRRNAGVKGSRRLLKERLLNDYLVESEREGLWLSLGIEWNSPCYEVCSYNASAELERSQEQRWTHPLEECSSIVSIRITLENKKELN
jgi:hypothetical protein